MTSEIRLAPGTLRAALRRRTQHALDVGALEPITTHTRRIDDGMRFVVRQLASVERKRRAGLMQRSTGENPFLPYDEDLFVGDITDTHVGLLNKFNVVDRHLLIVTRVFEAQESALERADFLALAACLAQVDGIGFYNAGEIAGASQPHKHLQLVPAPLDVGPDRMPLEPLLGAGGLGPPGELGRVATLPFSHVAARLAAHESPESAAACHTALYRRMLIASGLDAAQPAPYNLIVTRQHMLLVPRRHERFESISVNALGFVGSLLVRNEAEWSRLGAHGPMAVLRHVSGRGAGS